MDDRVLLTCVYRQSFFSGNRRLATTVTTGETLPIESVQVPGLAAVAVEGSRGTKEVT